MSTSVLTFAAVAATLYAGHQLADHVFGQTDRQAAHKADHTRTGWACLLGHVGAYHLVLTAMLLAAIRALHLPTTPIAVIAGLLFSAGTHTLLDRRRPVRWLLEHTGSKPFAHLASGGLNGMYLADQSLHIACLWISALLIACL
jgi:hypothetical protein